ncbi:MAG TPA: glycosyltransferase [Candidatus Binatia bacterium]|jgi:glycosyltransferase involved in cell wall biosynthesis
MSIPSSRAPLVSVIIPAYNAAGFVHQAVQSVLDQTYGNYEIIVVDDGSTDETREVLSRLHGRLTYLYQPNRGAAAARNNGIRAAKGDFVCFLDADDLWVSNKLQLQVDFLQQHPDMAFLSGRCRKFMDQGDPYIPFAAEALEGSVARIFSAPKAFAELVKFNFIPTSTVMIRKECFEKVGLFDLNLISVEDRDMWLRISASFGVVHLPWVLCAKRLHPTNISNDKTRMLYMRARVLEKNRALFPGLVSARFWNRQLAKLYANAGRLALINNRKQEARRAAIHSLKNELNAKAAMLWLATFMGRRAIRMFLRSRIQSRAIKGPPSGLHEVSGEAANP